MYCTEDASKDLLFEMREILESAVFRSGFNLIEIHGQEIKTQILGYVPITVKPFNATEAKDFLIEQGQSSTLAAEAVRELGEYSSFFYPGILLKGAAQYIPELIELTGKKPSAEDLALAIMEQAGFVALHVVKKCCIAVGCDYKESMYSLMAIALFRVPIANETLDFLNLKMALCDQLRIIGWLVHAKGIYLEGFGRDAIKASISLVIDDSTGIHGELNAEELRIKIYNLASDISSKWSESASDILEEALVWLARRIPNEAKLAGMIHSLLLQEAAADPVLPVLPKSEYTTARHLLQIQGWSADLDSIIGAVVIYSKAPINPISGKRTESLDDAANSLTHLEKLIGEKACLNDRQFSALDAALYSLCNRHYLLEESLAVRKRMDACISNLENDNKANSNLKFSSALLCFFVNTAELCISLDQAECAQLYILRATRLIMNLDLKKDARILSLANRLDLMRAHLAEDRAEQSHIFEQAAERGLDSLRLNPEDMKLFGFYLEIIRRLVDIEGDEDNRRDHVENARKNLDFIFGHCSKWNVSMRVQVAALMREEARRSWSLPYQISRAEEALSLLVASALEGSREIDTNPQACLVLARIQAFLGKKDEALKSCDNALALSPSAASWILKLRLLSDGDTGNYGWSISSEFDLAVDPKQEKLKAIRRLIQQLHEYIETHDLRSTSYGRASVRAIETQWSIQGSLLGVIKMKLSRTDRNFNELKKEEKLKFLTREFNERQRLLEGIKVRFGPIVELIIAEFRNKSQFVRLESIITSQEPKTNEALQILDKGLERYPKSEVLLFYRYDYLRYIWEFELAIKGLRTLTRAALDGDLRRRAAIALVRSLHQLAIYQEDETSLQRSGWLDEAKLLLEKLDGSFQDAIEIAALKDHVALELGEHVQFTELDLIFKKIVLKINGFPTTLIENYDCFVNSNPGAPESVAAALQSEFTNPHVMGLAGMLYLRRAEMQCSPDLMRDFYSALGLFLAQSVMEKSSQEKESPVTSFRIARLIVSAAESFCCLNPIEGFSMDGKKNQLALAEAKFNRVASCTTGKFRQLARSKAVATARLRREFGE